MTGYRPIQTPATLPEIYECRSLSIPQSQEWLGAVNSALLEMAKPSAWQQVDETDMTAEECAAICYQMYIEYLLSAKTGECTMSCDDVAACVLSDEGLQQAIIDMLVARGVFGAGAGGSQVGLQELLSALLGLISGTCTDEDRYGAAYKIVEMLNTVSVDLLEVIELLTDDAEIAYAIAGAIPVVGQFIQAGLKIANYLATKGLDVYPAAFNTASHEAVACNLFCFIPSATCEVHLEDILTAYNALLAGFAPPSAFATIEETAEWFFSLTLGTDVLIVAAMHKLLLEIWVRGSTVVSVSRNILTLAIDTSVPITVPCDPCANEWVKTFDFTIDDGNFETSYPAICEWTMGVGWQWNGGFSVQGSTYYGAVEVHRALPGVNYTHVEMTYTLTTGSHFVANGGGAVIRVSPSDELDRVTHVVSTDYGEETQVWDGARLFAYLEFIINVANRTGLPPTGGSCTLTQITLRGLGPCPFTTCD